MGALFPYGTQMNILHFGYADRMGLGVVSFCFVFKAHCVFSPCHFQSEHTGTAKCNICSLKHQCQCSKRLQNILGFTAIEGYSSLRGNKLAA